MPQRSWHGYMTLPMVGRLRWRPRPHSGLALLIFGYSWVPAFGVTGGAIRHSSLLRDGSLISSSLWKKRRFFLAAPPACRLIWRGTITGDSPGRRLVGNRQFDHQSHDRYHHSFVASAGVATLAGYGTGATSGIPSRSAVLRDRWTRRNHIGTNIGAGVRPRLESGPGPPFCSQA